MNRTEFMASAAAFGALARLQPDIADPAMNSTTQALRVLLGAGEARRIDAQTFSYNGKPYRGTYTHLPDTNEIVSVVALEAYLYSVVSREMPHSWPASALQAQAIVARTYVLQRSNPTRAYDLIPSEADQVYTGIDAETAQTSKAVNDTAGTVLRFSGAFAQVMYSSCCGGHTESSQNAWGGAAIAYLEGVSCSHCVDSPWYRWTQRLAIGRFREQLDTRIGEIGDLRSISPEAPDASGRARFWKLDGQNGSVRLPAAEIRRLLGTRALPSLLVRKVVLDQAPSEADRIVSIEGAGLGHGVGLCQWGARGMALRGADARAILSFYYPGTTIGND